MLKAISLHQPWATLVVIGAKRFETRGWSFLPLYRGPLLIHAAKSFTRQQQALCRSEPFVSTLRRNGYHHLTDLPLGKLLGSVDLVDAWWFDGGEELTSLERAFGNFAKGRFGLKFSDPRQFFIPPTWPGSQRFFNVPDRVVAQAMGRN